MQCSTIIWIHSHHATNLPVQIDPNEWFGLVDVLYYVTDDNNIQSIDIQIPCDTWVDAVITYELNEGQFCNVTITEINKNTKTTNIRK